MTETLCSYVGDREGALITYLYDEDALGPPGDTAGMAERAAFEAHLVTCALCTRELEALSGVRRGLLVWSPPERTGFQITGRPDSMASQPPSRWRHVHDMPAWAQVAAALLVLGVSAGIANLDIRYDERGLSIRTGWSKPSSATPATQATVNTGNQTPPWRADLTALEQRIRADLQAMRVSSAVSSRPEPQPVRSSAVDAELMRKLTALVNESERRQQSELALRVAELLRDVNAQRQADLVKIDYSQRVMQNNLGTEVLKQRDTLNYLIRASQRQ
jgi:hypothetical protein